MRRMPAVPYNQEASMDTPDNPRSNATLSELLRNINVYRPESANKWQRAAARLKKLHKAAQAPPELPLLCSRRVRRENN